MKKFDVLKWIRRVRDGHYQQQQNLSAEEKLKRTSVEAGRFRASRPEKKVSTGR